jgi:hypothetical protein
MQNTASSVESISLHDTVFVCVCVCVCFLPQFLEQKLVGSVLDLALKCCDDQLPPTFCSLATNRSALNNETLSTTSLVSHLSPCILQLKNHILNCTAGLAFLVINEQGSATKSSMQLLVFKKLQLQHQILLLLDTLHMLTLSCRYIYTTSQ